MLHFIPFDDQDSNFQGSSAVIDYALHTTLFSPCVIATTELGVCNLFFVKRIMPKAATEALIRSEWPEATLRYHPEQTRQIAEQLFRPELEDELTLNLHVKGTEFQQQVWRSLLTIPFGQTTTYQKIAIEIGRPAAARAVGNAVGQNPIAYLIPCHRVLRQSGESGDYRWGRELKQQLLTWEAEVC